MKSRKYNLNELPLLECEVKDALSLTGVLLEEINDNAPTWEHKNNSDYNTRSLVWTQHADEIHALTSAIYSALNNISDALHTIVEN